MRKEIQRKVISRRTGKTTTHTYDSISGIPVRDYFRKWARAHYVPHPRPERPNLSPDQTQQVIDLSSAGMSQLAITRTLGISRFRVQRALGKR